MPEKRGKFGFNWGTIVLLVWCTGMSWQIFVYYMDVHSSYIKQAQIQSQENFQQMGFPEGFEMSLKPNVSSAKLASNYFGSAIVIKRPTTPQEQQALKERVEKYYAEKLAKYGWVKVDGYKCLYKKGDRQWLNVDIDNNGNLITLSEQTTIFSWGEYITSSSLVEKDYKKPDAEQVK